jgi:hypothetical protein
MSDSEYDYDEKKETQVVTTQIKKNGKKKYPKKIWI